MSQDSGTCGVLGSMKPLAAFEDLGDTGRAELRPPMHIKELSSKRGGLAPPQKSKILSHVALSLYEEGTGSLVDMAGTICDHGHRAHTRL